MSVTVPWNASWSGEERFEVRPCRYADGRLAMWQPFAPGEGTPLFAKPHAVRQRRSIAEMRCTVCGEQMPADDRWWFGLGSILNGAWATTEAPVHHTCADIALRLCPHLRRRGVQPQPMPGGYIVIASLIGGEAVKRDFVIEDRGQRIVGQLKLSWPLARVADQVRAMHQIARKEGAGIRQHVSEGAA